MLEIEYGFDEEYENFPKSIVKNYLLRLKECNAPQSVILQFHSLLRTADGMIDELRDPVERYFLEACREANFIRPFEPSGEVRFFRPDHIPHKHPDHVDDCATDNNPGEEQAYRRGFSQGFAEVLHLIKSGEKLHTLEAQQKKIDLWRFRRVQAFRSRPGYQEEIENGVRLASRRSPIRPKLRMEVFKSDSFRCRLCGASADEGATLEIDHIVPISKGGTNQINNLQTLCWDCNRGKSDDYLT